MAGNRNYTPRERRAINIIWTAANRYDFEPCFFAFLRNGDPDLYMNLIIGFAYRIYGREQLDSLFALLSNSVRRDLFDGLLWIALEHSLFLREEKDRPILAQLRKDAAQLFFEQEKQKTRQDWMSQNTLLYTLQAARWRSVLGLPNGLLSPRSRALFEALQYPPDLSFDALRERTLRLLQQYFHYHETDKPHAFSFHVSGRLAAWLMRLFPSRIEQNELLHIGASDRPQAGKTGFSNEQEKTFSFGGRRKLMQDADTAAYVQEVFGDPLFSPQETEGAEHLLCTGCHFQSRLYFTNGQKETTAVRSARIQKLAADAKAQQKRNIHYFETNRAQFQSCIRRLCAALKNEVDAAKQPDALLSRHGRLFATRVWRAVYLNDPRVFFDAASEPLPRFSVDIALDASASRLETQAQIAAQAYVIAKSLQQCSIPVQVSSFLSLQAYTIINRYCTYGEVDQDARIFEYYAAGWNRDGLALRAIGKLMEASGEPNRILIIMTDACPNDNREIPADREAGRPLPKIYADAAAIEDTASVVQELRKHGIRTAAILTGQDASLETAQRIYGTDFIRIEKMEQLGDAVSTLLTKEIQSLSASF